MLKIETVLVEDIVEYENNAKEHTDEQINQIVKSIEEFGFNDPIAIDENNVIIEGHGRLYAVDRLGYKEVPVIRLNHLNEDQKKAYILAHNKLTMNTDFDIDLLNSELEYLKDTEIDMSDFGFEIEDDYQTLMDKVKENPIGSNLFDTFIVPPFSVLDTKSGVWQNRKKQWRELGIASEVGRGENLTFSKNLNAGALNGTSIFDPVLCEVGYLWFTPKQKGKIYDPFAGGSVRGVVAERLGFDYVGIDLRQEQVDANYNNAKEIGCDLDKIIWHCDDSQNVDKYVDDESVDLVFTCPPYFDLEVYSDDDKDISNMEYDDFVDVYTTILRKAARKLKNNRFAVVTISDVRDKKGFYRDLTGVTKQAFESEGVLFYNDIILLNTVGTGALRARKLMATRKVVRTHQNVLVFFKGDPKNIKGEFSILENVDYEILEENDE